ncbi:hypothetical protein J6590_016764 [Homalodisca vitripennis]|nr:hypothetical protein J6590_016764 [Homalodisca vitripennis]
MLNTTSNPHQLSAVNCRLQNTDVSTHKEQSQPNRGIMDNSNHTNRGMSSKRYADLRDHHVIQLIYRLGPEHNSTRFSKEQGMFSPRLISPFL